MGDFNGVKAVNREEACLYALNTLTATMVEYEKNSTVTVGNITITDQSSAKDMVHTCKTDGKIFKADGKMQFAEKYFDNLSVTKGSDDFARPANVWKLKAEKIGTYTDTADLTYTKKVEAGDIYKDLDLGSAIEKKDVSVYINGEEATDAEVAIKKGSEDKIGFGVYDNTKDKEIGTNGNGVLTEVFYDDDADTVTITQILTYVGEINKTVKATAKKDAYVVIGAKTGDNNKYLSAPKSLKGESASKLEYETDDKYDDDTYVLYTYSFKADEVKSIAVAEKVEGYVSKTINKVTDLDKNNGMTIAGTDYKMSLTTAGEKLGNVSVKQDYTVYLDQYGYIIYVEEIQEIGNYALVLATASKGSFIGDKAQLLLTDGTVKFVNTDENYNSGKNEIAPNTIVTFRENSDGTYTLKEVSKNNGTKTNEADMTSFVMTNDKAGIQVMTDTTVNANSASVFVVADKPTGKQEVVKEADDAITKHDHSDIDDWTSYTGIKNAPSVKDGSVAVYYYCKSGKMVTVMFVVPNSKATVADDNKNMIFLANKSASDLIHDEDGDYFEYNAIVDGKISTVKVKYNTVVNKVTADDLNGLFSNYSTNNKSYITDLTPYAKTFDNKSAEKAVINGLEGIDKTSKEYTISVGYSVDKKGDVSYDYTITVDDNAKIYFVDKDGNISESSYSAIYPDDNDLVYAVVEDYLVKTLVIQEVKDKDTSKPVVKTDYTFDSVSATLEANNTVKVSTSIQKFVDDNWDTTSNCVVTFVVTNKTTGQSATFTSKDPVTHGCLNEVVIPSLTVTGAGNYTVDVTLSFNGTSADDKNVTYTVGGSANFSKF